MKPETAAYHEKAQALLLKATRMAEAGWPDEAGRAAYLAGFHAAQALIYEYTGRSAKTHSGVQSEFARLVRNDPRFDVSLRPFLARAYTLKAAADYEVGFRASVSPDQATEAITKAIEFVAAVARMI